MGIEQIAGEALKYVGAGGGVGIIMALIGAKVLIHFTDAIHELTAVMNEVKGILEERNRRRSDA